MKAAILIPLINFTAMKFLWHTKTLPDFGINGMYLSVILSLRAINKYMHLDQS